MLRPYQAIVSARFRTLLQHRAAALAGFATQLFWGLIRVMIFEAFFRSTSTQQPMDLADGVTYIWLGQAFFILLPWNVDRDIQALIRSGAVSYELLRPLDLYTLWFSRALAWRTAPTLLWSVPLLAMAVLFFDMQAPRRGHLREPSSCLCRPPSFWPVPSQRTERLHTLDHLGDVYHGLLRFGSHDFLRECSPYPVLPRLGAALLGGPALPWPGQRSFSPLHGPHPSW